MTRREWIAAGATGLVAASRARAETSDLGSRICVFTDHLAGFPYEDVARMLRDLKVAGPDLTVRPGGLVKPERVSEDLPRVLLEYDPRTDSVAAVGIDGLLYGRQSNIL